MGILVFTMRMVTLNLLWVLHILWMHFSVCILLINVYVQMYMLKNVWKNYLKKSVKKSVKYFPTPLVLTFWWLRKMK